MNRRWFAIRLVSIITKLDRIHSPFSFPSSVSIAFILSLAYLPARAFVRSFVRSCSIPFFFLNFPPSTFLLLVHNPLLARLLGIRNVNSVTISLRVPIPHICTHTQYLYASMCECICFSTSLMDVSVHGIRKSIWWRPCATVALSMMRYSGDSGGGGGGSGSIGVGNNGGEISLLLFNLLLLLLSSHHCRRRNGCVATKNS